MNKMPHLLPQRRNLLTRMRNFDLRPYFTLNVRLVCLLPYIAIAALFIITPMVMLLVKAVGHNSDRLAATEFVADYSVWQVIGRSIYLGLAAGAIALFLAFPFAFTVARAKSRVFRMMSVTLLISPLFIFTIAKVFALKIVLIKMFDGYQSIQNEGVMICGMVYLYMPFAIIPLYSVLSQMPESLIEASRDLGYSRLSSIVRVVVPYALKAIFSGLAIVFMLSATTLVISGTLVGTAKSPNPHLMLIGNMMDLKAVNMRQNTLDGAKGSLLALVTIAVMMSVYGLIYALPALWRKIKGGVNA